MMVGAATADEILIVFYIGMRDGGVVEVFLPLVKLLLTRGHRTITLPDGCSAARVHHKRTTVHSKKR